jgi:hypothetical protein
MSQALGMNSKLARVLALTFSSATILIAACSSSTTHPPIGTGAGSTSTGGGGGGVSLEGGATTDGAADLDSGHCLNGTFDKDADSALGGANEIAGAVLFSTTVASGHTVVLTVTSTTNPTITYADTFAFSVAKDSFTFRVRGLPDGTYSLQAQADITGAAGVTDAGDLDGYYGGTTLTPIHTRADGTSITVPACKGGAELGIGPKQ